MWRARLGNNLRVQASRFASPIIVRMPGHSRQGKITRNDALPRLRPLILNDVKRGNAGVLMSHSEFGNGQRVLSSAGSAVGTSVELTTLVSLWV